MKNDSALQALLNLNSGSCDIGGIRPLKRTEYQAASRLQSKTSSSDVDIGILCSGLGAARQWVISCDY